MIGETLKHYKIVSQIGSGGMGEVYVAEDTKLDRKVAVKVLSASTGLRTPTAAPASSARPRPSPR